MSFNIELLRKVNEKFKRFIKRFDLKDYEDMNILVDIDVHADVHADVNIYFIFERIYNLIKSNYRSSIIYESDIYTIIIFLYYGLVLFEPHNNLLYFSDLERLSINSRDTEQFCMKIAISNEEYCSKIRRHFFNMDSCLY